MKVKPFNCLGSRWNEVEKSSLGNEYVLLKRPVSMSVLRKRGVFVSTADIHINSLPKRIVQILTIVNSK